MYKVQSGLVLALAVSAGLLGASGAFAGSQENFIASDGNGDGALNRSEFRRFIDRQAADGITPAPTIKAENSYDEAFDWVDTNGDGLFSVDEATGTETADWNIR